MNLSIRALLTACAIVLTAAAARAQEIYWERPQVFDDQGVRFSFSAAGGGRMVVAWEEVVPGATAGSGTFYLSVGASPNGATWTWHRRFFGPIQYSGLEPGAEPLLYSMAVQKDGRILVAVTSAEREISILESTDANLSFAVIARLPSELSLVAPSLFQTDSGTLLLFATRELTGRTGLSLAWSSSRDGRTWAAFAPFVARGEPGEGIQLQPDHAVIHGREVIVFQAQRPGAEDYQLYVKESLDGGATWQKSQEVTGLPEFKETVAGTEYDARNFTNQRPSIAPVGSGLGLAWERGLLGGATADIYYCELDDSGRVIKPMSRVDPTPGTLFAQIIPFGSRELLLYEQNAAGFFRVVLSEKDKAWNPQVVGRGLTGSSQWPHAVAFKGSLYLFWEVKTAESSRLVALRPKTSVTSPSLVAVGFQSGVPVRSDVATVRWKQPDDSVGIESYDVAVSFGDTVVDRKTLVADSIDMTFTRPVSKDGTWRIEVIAQDLARNRSKPVYLDFVRKTTSPHPVTVAALPTDTSGFLPSNSFTIRWSPSTDPDVVGYTWEEQRVAATPQEFQQSSVKLLQPPDRPLTTATSVAFDNLENGVHAVTIQAIDKAGNVSEPTTVFLRLDKYKVFTAIYAVLRTVDDLGNVHLSIRGRGFTTNGTVQAIYLTRSETPPYDRVLNAGTDAFSVAGDTEISGLVLDNSFPSGSYVVGLLQTSGKPYFWPGGRIEFEVPGTIRVGSFSLLLPRWIAGGAPRYGASVNSLIVVLVVFLLVVVAIVSLRSMVSVAQEGILIRNEILAILEGRPAAAWAERKSRMKELRRRGVGLRVKFTLLMVVLVAIIVLIVSVPLGVQMIGQQSQSLADGLEKRTRLLIGTIAASAEAEIRKGVGGGGDTGIGPVTDIIKPMEEAVFTTVTGPADPTSNPDAVGRDYVWASNSDAWKKNKAAGTFVVAAEPERDELSATIVPQQQKSINEAAPRALEAELADWQKSRDRIQELSTRANRTLQQQAELQGIFAGMPKKVTAIDNGLKTLPENNVYSQPHFDAHRQLAPRYLFYKPIVFFHPEDKSFYQGLVRIEVDTRTITRQIAESRNGLIKSTALIALAAIGLGILMAIIMASITVTPIRKLARGVQIISDTEDKEELKDHRITVRTRDEIGELAATVNEMTHGLVEAAKANKQLMIGKDVQKRFLPLVKSTDKKSSNTAEEENDKVVMYGYYEGAKGVSGDYFDLKKLDDVHYALIKCDVSGKGVPAALIMVEVATLFINYFRDWLKRKEQIMKIADPKQRQNALKGLERVDSLVYTINDMVEERGFDGRFAALTICIYNSATGEASICHAGDNIVNIYRAAERRMVPITLAKAPAAGSFASFMVESTSPYTQVVQKLAPGDVLFFYTDGLEEAQRNLRNEQFQITPCREPGLKDEEWHGTHQKGKTSEEFGTDRIKGVIEAVFTKGRFRLVRSHNPIPNEDLEFDFSGCDGKVKDAVLALIAVEKVYRQIPDPSAGPESRVHVYEQVDAFLRKTFIQYGRYFSHPVEGQQTPGYLTFTHAKEDEQYDDLTLLVIRRK